MKRLVMLVVSIAAASILASCDLFSGLAGGAAGTDDAPFVYFAESSGGSIDLSLSAAAGRSASVVFTTGPYEGLAAPTATARDSSDVPAAASRLSAQDAFSDRLRSYARENANAYIPPIRPRFSTTGDPAHDVAGATPSEASFYVIANSSSSVDFDVISSSCRAVRDDTTFSDTRTRTLSVWVADDCWDLGSTKKHAVNQTMVDAIAEKFFGASSDPDTSIYAWVTGMLGDEWGVHDESTRIGFGTYDLIAKSDNITILLADIGSDDADDGGIVGYFYPVDTFAGADNSNERIMFIIDAVMYSNPDDSGISSNEPGYSDNGWSDEDYWAEQVFSTLAHEFQHMIHFYQKGVLRGGDYFNEATWIDELCAMQVEDLLADKLGVAGPRGMDPADYSAGVSGNIYGRLPEYLLFPDVTPYDWDTAADAELTRYYSWAYAFGAYLTRNY
nr:hypothetical protein [Spirochaetales bacterium]